MAFACPACEDTGVELVEITDDAKTRLRCRSWERLAARSPGQPVPATPASGTARRTRLSHDEAKARFPSERDLTEAVRSRVAELKRRFLARQPEPDPRVEPYGPLPAHLLPADGLRDARPADLKAFANNRIGANPGNMSVFNDAWNALGAREAAARVCHVIDYLPAGRRRTSHRRPHADSDRFP